MREGESESLGDRRENRMEDKERRGLLVFGDDVLMMYVCEKPVLNVWRDGMLTTLLPNTTSVHCFLPSTCSLSLPFWKGEKRFSFIQTLCEHTFNDILSSLTLKILTTPFM
jgi:hypothetical protein